MSSGNQHFYSIQVSEISVFAGAVVTVSPDNNQMGLRFQWNNGTTLCWFGGTSLATGGTFGVIVPSSTAALGAAATVDLGYMRGPVYFVGGAASTASVIRVLKLYSSADAGAAFDT